MGESSNTFHHPRTYGILLFGGIGKRFGWVKPKQFFLLPNGKMIMEFVVERFVSWGLFHKIIVVTAEEWREETEKVLAGLVREREIELCVGGVSRERSVLNALYKLEDVANEEDIVLIHDGARPLVSRNVVERNLEACKKYGAVVTAINATDTVSLSRNGESVETVVQRQNVYLHQTPQTFKYGILRECFQRNLEHLDQFSDDASIVFSCGYKVFYVEGERTNVKLTTFEDLYILKALIESGAV
ncbi:2-C-methyl-D-erythritol 4-phosphate cytidylyltransferase [Fervidobacterium thailandense]|uniref:2-C-methyl-D-erythritol 4-phosphate cytidylyltransferase n=1 Tax=Fervidobacterium thailandense TaxID=1008305 RepID=A0A1E3G447_9BACT|nr:2-C-methyl-D-erythritol 4-phosphate cytidylyltransferase [Fervidobacterium thailandense]ODN31066.1 2-C-methyl-D-erythritol 4-phosphate cytidylyltransferase [Fervidobacterium thailandense]